MVLADRLLRLGALALLLLAIILVPFALWGEALEQWATERAWPDEAPTSIAALGMALLASDVLLPVPSSIVGTLLGALLGAAVGTFVGALGMTLGCGFGYLLGRSMGSHLIGRLVKADELRLMQAWLDRRGVSALAVFRAVPVLAEASVIAAGAMRMPFSRVLAVTGLANLGVSGVYASLGSIATDLATFVLALMAAIALPALVLAGMAAARHRVSR